MIPNTKFFLSSLEISLLTLYILSPLLSISFYTSIFYSYVLFFVLFFGFLLFDSSSGASSLLDMSIRMENNSEDEGDYIDQELNIQRKDKKRFTDYPRSNLQTNIPLTATEKKRKTKSQNQKIIAKDKSQTRKSKKNLAPIKIKSIKKNVLESK